MNLEQHQTGGLDLMGQMWSWVSVEAAAVATIVGTWSDVLEINADRGMVAIASDRQRVNA